MKKVNRENIREINKSRKQGYKYKRNKRVYIIQKIMNTVKNYI